VQDVGLRDLQAVERVDAAIEPAEPPGELAHCGELATEVLAAALGEERLAALLRHLAAVLDAPLRHRHVADGREDVRVEPGLASLDGAWRLAALFGCPRCT